jgi:glutaminyl-tRNA synthetase
LVNEHHVKGWDDPRMPTISGLRRRGVTPEALRAFASGISVTRTNRTVDFAVLENAIRDDLNTRSPRVMAVLRPLRVVIENAKDTMLELPYWPQDVVSASVDGLVSLPNGQRVKPEDATRAVPFTPEIFIEREDFEVEPPKGFKRLTLHGKVRLRGAGVIECHSFETDDAGNLTMLHCTLLPDTEKAPGVIHWVSSSKSIPFEARLYDRLFRVPHPEAEAKELEDENDPDDTTDFLSFLNPNSLETVIGFLEPSVLNDPVDTRYQFERLGYFWRDQDSDSEKIVMDRIITLRDSWGAALSGHAIAVATATGELTVDKVSQSPREIELSLEQFEVASKLATRGVTASDASVLAREPKLAAYLEEAAQHGDIAALSSWVVNDLGTPLREGDVKISPAQLAALVKLVQDGALSRNQAKTVLEKALLTGDDPAVIVERDGLKQVSDAGALEPVVDGVIAANPQKLEEYRSGRKGLLGFFVGQVMQATKGQGNPQLVQEIVKRKLEA